MSWCRKAAELNPQESRYAFTLAFYQQEQGDLPGAAATLKDFLAKHPGFTDGQLLLAEIYRGRESAPGAEALLRQSLQGKICAPQRPGPAGSGAPEVERLAIYKGQPPR